MEFICVLSVGGSLASYQVRKEEIDKYTAVLKTNSGKRDDLPGEIRLKKNENGWHGEPWHPEIVTGLGHAIDSNG
ncbi:MAG TPA: hypothetical protein VF609_01830 [Flavisolibacter sp.]|jgi:hypothetical protein